MTMASDGDALELDTTDVDRWLGVPLQRLQPRYPITESDIGRWAQGMQTPNPLYYDPEFAAASKFGGVTCCSVGMNGGSSVPGSGRVISSSATPCCSTIA